MGAFIRQCQLFIKPLDEVDGGGDVSDAIVINSEGRQQDLRISFRIMKNTMGFPNTSNVVIYNLSQATRQELAKSGKAISIQAGYKQGGAKLQTITTGAIGSYINSREGGVVKTNIFSLDGGQSLGIGRYWKAWRSEQQLKDIVKDVASNLKGVTVSEDEIKLDGIQVGRKGRTLVGRCVDILDELGRQWGFSWYIDNGVMKAIPDVSSSQTTFTISYKNKNLIHATPTIDNLVQIQTGIEIQTFLDPRIKPFDNIELESEVAPNLNGTYNVTNVSFIGDTHGKQWFTIIQCIFKGAQLQEQLNG